MKWLVYFFSTLLFLMPLNCFSFAQMGSFISLEGMHITDGSNYSPLISNISDSNSAKSEGDYYEFSPDSNNIIKLRAFEGNGLAFSFGYSMGGNFSLSMTAEYHYRDDFANSKEDWNSGLRIENETVSGMVNVSYEYSIGRAFTPFVLVGAGVASRSMNGSYGVLGNEYSSGTSDDSNCPTRSYFSDVEQTYFAYKAQAGLMIMFNEQAGISLGYQIAGSKDLNVLRDNATALELDLPTKAGNEGIIINKQNITYPLVSNERFYLKNLKYVSHSINFGVRMYV